MTNLTELIGRELSVGVAESVDLKIKVLNEKEVQYQFIGTNDGTKDTTIITNLEIAYDDIECVEDYSFTDGIATRFFLFQFSR